MLEVLEVGVLGELDVAGTEGVAGVEVLSSCELPEGPVSLVTGGL